MRMLNHVYLLLISLSQVLWKSLLSPRQYDAMAVVAMRTENIMIETYIVAATKVVGPNVTCNRPSVVSELITNTLAFGMLILLVLAP